MITRLSRPFCTACACTRKIQAPSVEAFCNRLHKGIKDQFKYAWVWGSSVKHQPQRVGLDHILCDEDVVQIVKR